MNRTIHTSTLFPDLRLAPDTELPGADAPQDEGDGTLEINGERLTADEIHRRVSEYSRLQAQLDELKGSATKAQRVSAATLALTQATTPGEAYDHAFTILTDGRGMSPEAARMEAQRYVQQLEAMQRGQQGGREGQREEQQEPEWSGAYQETSQRLESQSRELARLRAESVANKIRQRALDGEGRLDNVKSTLDALKKLPSGGSVDPIREEVAQRAAARLQHRMNASGSQFNESWIGEETDRAWNDVIGKYRSVIGDPSKLGPAATVSEQSSALLQLKEKKPVEPPKGRAAPEEAFDSYMTDQLRRGLADAEVGEETV